MHASLADISVWSCTAMNHVQFTRYGLVGLCSAATSAAMPSSSVQAWRPVVGQPKGSRGFEGRYAAINVLPRVLYRIVLGARSIAGGARGRGKQHTAAHPQHNPVRQNTVKWPRICPHTP